MATDKHRTLESGALSSLDIDYYAIESKLDSAVTELNVQQQILSSIDRRLQSWAFKISEFINPRGNSIVDLKQSSKEEASINSLSKQELLIKKSDAITKIKTIMNEIHELQLIHKHLVMEARIKRAEIMANYNLKMAENYIPLFKKDPEEFFKGTIIEIHASRPEQKDQIYKNADQLIVVSEAFDENTDPRRVLQSWKIVMKALDLANEDVRRSRSDSKQDILTLEKQINAQKKYYDGAKQMFSNILLILPSGMQGLMFLYAARDYDRIEFYLSEASKYSTKEDTSELDRLVNELSEEVAIASSNSAARVLANIPEFNRLPKKYRDQLIAQQAYVNQLRFDLSFVDDEHKNIISDQLSKYASKLQENIIDAIDNTRTSSQVMQDFETIKANIDEREAEIRNYWFKQQLAEYPHIALGLGMGLGWILGAGAPAGLMLGGLALMAKAKFETSSMRMKIYDIEEDITLAKSVLPVDYKFIHDVDALWGYGMNVPTANIKVEFVSLTKNATEYFQSNVVKPITEVNSSLERTMNVLIGVSFLSLITSGLTLPIIWPLYAAAGLFAGLAASYYAAEKYMPKVSSSSSAFQSFIQLLGQSFDYFVVQPIKYVIYQIRKVDPKIESKVVDLNVYKTNFVMSKEDILALEIYSPGLAKKLGEHFQSRAVDLSGAIDHAKDVNNINAAAAISADLDSLSADWNSIIASISNKEKFCTVVEQYLDDRYAVEREEYVYASKHRMKEYGRGRTYNHPAKKSNMLFTQQPEFNMEFDTNYVNERKNMQELYVLKDRIVHIKRSF